MAGKEEEPFKGPTLWHRDEDWRQGTTEGVHSGKYGATLGNTRGARMTSGFHHLAMVCKDMTETIKFYEGALGMKLRAIYPMHGIKGAKHCFLEAGNGNELSFVEFQDPEASRSPPSFFQVWPVGMQHHLALRVESLAQLHALREQIKKYGTPVSKVVDHDFIHSVYFTDPSGYNLELTCTLRGYGEPEYDLSVLGRRLSEAENSHAASDTHGKNVTKAKL